jgi:hypothetical protein
VVLARDVVVVAVDGHAAERERGDRPGLAERLQGRLHHQLAVVARVVLGPLDRLDVVAEVLGALRQIREVLVGQVDHPALHLPLGEGDEVRADAVADPARARVQHDPHVLALVEAHLDEVVAGPERAEVHGVFAFSIAGCFATMRSKRSARPAQTAPTGFGGSCHAPLSRRRG